MCSTANGGTSQFSNDGTVRLLESSYTREFGGNKVPEDYAWMTYDEWDAEDKPWLTSPARLPMHGKHMLKMMAESVGLACVTNDDASKYCFKEFSKGSTPRTAGAAVCRRCSPQRGIRSALSSCTL